MKRLAFMLCALFVMACGPGEQGPAGPPGPRGEAGPAGPRGEPGAPGVGLKETRECVGFIDVTGDGRGYVIRHDVSTFADGSVLATCEIDGTSITVSSTWLWKTGTVGAARGVCRVTMDTDTTPSGGLWEMSLSSDKSTAIVEYDDDGSPFDGGRYSVSCTLY